MALERKDKMYYTVEEPPILSNQTLHYNLRSILMNDPDYRKPGYHPSNQPIETYLRSPTRLYY